MENQRENILITYDCKSEKFQYPDSMEKHFAARFDNRSLGQIMKEDRFASKEDVEQFDKMLNEIAGADTPQVFFAEYKLKAADQSWKWYRLGFVCTIPQDLISITVTNM